MPTFLPFPRAVKAPAVGLAVCALIFGSGASCLPACSAQPILSAASAPVPPLAAGGAANPSSPPGLNVAAATAPLSNAGAAPRLDTPPAPLIVIDLPYPVDARPRAADPAQAAADDEELARWNVGGSSDPNAVSNQASYHPGTRVVVDTRPAKRRSGAPPLPPPKELTYQRVQAQARSRGYWPFRSCFEHGQREKKSAGGETRVAFTIGTRGKVSAARLLDSKLGNAESAACLVREVLKLEFTPAPAKKLRMVASIQIYPGDAELPTEPEGPAVALPGGEFDPEAMRARVLQKQAELESCFDRARRADPALWGRLALSVILEIDGSVHRVSEVESHFPNASATRCAQVLVSSLVYPSVNGKPFSFVVPLRLGPPTAPERRTGPDESPSPSDVRAEAGDD
ncbi:MAG TPA: AgmX/PglI C-terminal domain-containing protein [Polyangiaceae bacterium]|nr:AgmX/PglI C-terminal domain-containing protein [Polyangiaceae bacterium]